MEIKIKNISVTEIKSDLLIVNLFEGTTLPGGATGAVDKELSGLISDYVIKKEGFNGQFGKMYVLSVPNHKNITKVLIAGLGKRDDFNLNKLREICSKIIQKVKTMDNVKNVVSMLHGAGCAGFEPEDCARIIVEGTMIGGYSFDKYKSETKEAVKTFTVVEVDKTKFSKAEEGFSKGLLIGDTINYAKDLITEPAEIITPAKLADIASNLDLDEVKIYEKKDIQNMQMGAFMAVSQGSIHSPRFIHMEYIPKKPKKKIVLIGKGITFDAGGLNLKPATSMMTMKNDMSGAAVVLSIMRNIKKLKPTAEIHALIAACENMPSGSSYKQGDVVVAMNGKSIEIDNTDAEGRLTLADALCYAQQLNPDVIIDIATLTGACMVALGSVASGILGNHDELIQKLIRCGKDGGERLWQMPMYPEYFESLKSDIADMKNSGARGGGTTAATLFLKNFVKDGTPWAHIDIAGTAVIDKPILENPKGATAVGVRTLLNYIMSE
ncbi:leucyl aminopeptidase [bacterium]|nr:leucyl aminopeptidase [bacterium]